MDFVAIHMSTLPAFAPARPVYSVFNLKQDEFLWERPPGRDKLDCGQEAAPTKASLYKLNLG